MTPKALYAPARLAGAPLLRTQSDERLVDLVRVGNDGAFEAIVARYRRQLLRYCSTLLPEGRAEDAVQQTFLRAFDALRASEGEMNLRPWLYRIAHNQSLNVLRDRSLAHEELSESIDGVERPDQAFEKHQRLRDTFAAVVALPERQRNAIVLRELEGRSYEEIATELGVTGGAVRALLNRARDTLRSGATALTPYGLMARWPFHDGGPMADRVAEICSAGAGGAAVAKLCATALVTGAVVGGVATSPDGGPADGRAGGSGEAVAQTPSGSAGARAAAPATQAGGDHGNRVATGGPTRRARGKRDEDADRGRSDRGRDDDGGNEPSDDRSGIDDDSSGPGPGGAPEEEDHGSSGPGSGGGSEPGDDRSGPGGGGLPEAEPSEAGDPPETPEPPEAPELPEPPELDE
jgi:RNA polymerase sigma factor (sigma-70 family)